jgi:hypothetical protein
MKLPPIEEQVCSFEQAIKLKELGIMGNTYCYWVKYQQLHKAYLYTINDNLPVSDGLRNINIYSAPMVVELFKMLPPFIIHEEKEYNILVMKNTAFEYLCGYEHQDNEAQEAYFLGDKPHISLKASESMADQFIWLLEHDYLKAEDLNG